MPETETRDKTPFETQIHWRRSLLPVFVLTLIAVIVTTYVVLTQSQRRLIDSEALKIADVITLQALAARTVYTTEVADKLIREGGGVSEDFAKRRGHVPLPAQFLKMAGQEAGRSSGGLYMYHPLSKWNLGTSQGLVDEFQQWGWQQLAAQDQAYPSREIEWQPVWRFESSPESRTRTLRFMRADPASSATCVSCHNAYEKQPAIRALRKAAGVEPGKQWQLHQLLGALEVSIPMAQIEAIASDDTRRTLGLVTGISTLGLLLTGWLAWRDSQQQRMLTARYEYQANFDALTHLPNRALFQERALEALKRAGRDGDQAALIFIDLDNFKNINDSLGHEAGDKVLGEISRRLKGALREVDTVARHSGDEFTVIVNGISSSAGLGAIARKLAEALAAPLNVDGHEMFVTASQGISVFPQDGGDVETLLKNADTAMYRAKARGRNNYQFFSAEMNAAVTETLRLSADLGRAFERGELELHYQPRIDARTGAISCVEALVRWRHPTLGLLFPNRFVPLAEESGMIGVLGDWVLHTVCAQIAIWQEQKTQDRAPALAKLRVAINLSMRQFRRANMVEHVVKLTQRLGTPLHKLEFEVTESVVMENPEVTQTTLTQLRNLGTTIAVDDFGTGYSSLAYLKTFPVDALKIDKTFVDGLPDDKNDAAITRAIIAMSKSLGLQVIAEGVENEAQRAFLEQEGCDEMQGYLFSVPLPAPQLEKLLRDPLSKSGRYTPIELPKFVPE